MSQGHRDYSHRRPELFKTPYLIATYSTNDRAKTEYDRFFKQRQAVIEQGPTPQERFEALAALLAKWHGYRSQL
jgi:hypothetical protein